MDEEEYKGQNEIRNTLLIFSYSQEKFKEIYQRLICFFYYNNPLRKREIIEFENGSLNYLFTVGESVELFDLQEDSYAALCQAMKLDDVELLSTLLKAPLSIDKLVDLEQLLRKVYEGLKDKLSQDMKNYIENKLKLLHSLEEIEEKYIKPNE